MGHVLHPLSLYEPCGSLPVRNCQGWGLQKTLIHLTCPWTFHTEDVHSGHCYILAGCSHKKTQNLSFQWLTSTTDHVKHLMSLQHQLPATEMNQWKHLPVKVLPQFPTFLPQNHFCGLHILLEWNSNYVVEGCPWQMPWCLCDKLI